MEDKRMNQFETAMRDTAFAEKIAGCETPEALKAAFEKANIEFTAEEAVEIMNVIRSQASADGELSVENLDAVAGGWVGGVVFLVGCAIAGYAYGRYAKNELGICKN